MKTVFYVVADARVEMSHMYIDSGTVQYVGLQCAITFPIPTPYL